MGRRVELNDGRAFERELRSRPDPIDAASVIAAGYLARQRLGLGSPFRLAEFALRDARLGTARRMTALAILASAADGRGNHVDPEAFASSSDGTAHLAVIAGVIADAPSPRAGELAVRLAYQLAEYEGIVTRPVRRVADRAAAVLRDREQARRDVTALLQAADAEHRDPLTVMIDWRRGHRFQVERPLTGGEASTAEDDAMRAVPAALVRIREMAPVPTVPVQDARLSIAAARRLNALADSGRLPPRPSIVIPVRQFRSGITSRAIPAADRRLMERFASVARDEAHFAAAHTLLDASLRSAGARTAFAVMSIEAAVAMAVHGQERVWQPGTAGPTEVDLQWRYGLAAIEFSPRVPSAWRPYLLFALDGALADWSAVFPASTLQGVSIWFGDEGVPARALAIHSPRTATVRLPPTTGFGNLAHELGHELDRAESARRYGSGSRYATDDVVRHRHRDPFALASSAMLTPPAEGPNDGETPEWDYLSRPAEIFARNVDWYVASVLADRRRQNGDLSTVQDELLSGYGNLETVGAVDSASEALTRTLLLMVPLPEVDLNRFTARYGAAVSPRPSALAAEIARRRATERGRVGADSTARERWLSAAERELVRIHARAARARQQHARCVARGPEPFDFTPSPLARRRLIHAAEEAGRRRILRDEAVRLAGPAGAVWIFGDETDPAGSLPYLPPGIASWVRRLALSPFASPALPPEPCGLGA
jgi:hypothetical protein